MKNALILHATDNNSQGNWYPWVKKELENKGYAVWVPDLPHAERPSIRRYNEFILGNKDWKFSSDSVLIGHSSGAVAILGLLQALPDREVVDTCILVSAFRNDLGWDNLKDLFLDPFDFEKIRKHARRIVLIHADDDPYCKFDEHVSYLKERLHAELHMIPGQKHFSIGTMGGKYKEFPLLIEILEK